MDGISTKELNIEGIAAKELRKYNKKDPQLVSHNGSGSKKSK